MTIEPEDDPLLAGLRLTARILRTLHLAVQAPSPPETITRFAEAGADAAAWTAAIARRAGRDAPGALAHLNGIVQLLGFLLDGRGDPLGLVVRMREHLDEAARRMNTGPLGQELPG